MNLWSRIRGWFAPPTTPRHRAGDVELRWRPDVAEPLTVFLDPSARAWFEEVRSAVRAINAAAGRMVFTPFLFDPLPEVVAIFARQPETGLWLQGCVYVTVIRDTAHTVHEISLDGFVNAVKVYLPPRLGARLPAQQVLHELAHAGPLLGHNPDPASVMNEKLRSAEQRLTEADVRGLRRKP